MGVGKKFDHEPLLAPGRHVMTLPGLEQLVAGNFDGNICRRDHFHRLEEFIQALLVQKVPCEVWVDGSFLTAKDDPDDVDVAVIIEHDVGRSLSDEQRAYIDALETSDWSRMDIFTFVRLAKDDPNYGDENLDPAHTWHEQWGKENSGEWLKGFAVLKLGETRVGLRICS